MMRWRYVLVPLFMVMTLTTAAEAVDKEKLRRAVSLPWTSARIGFGLNDRGEFRIRSSGDTVPEPEKIAQMEKDLKGDATDAERYRRLANLYFRAGQSAKGKDAHLKAAALYRKQLEQHPDDIAVQLRLADALDCAEKSEEAETLARRVVINHPDDWHAWLVLGGILHGKSCRAIIGGQSSHWTNPEALLQIVRAAQPTPEKIAASQQYRREAVACFDRAVSLASGEAEVYRRRGASRYTYGFIECGLRLYKGEKADFLEYYLARDSLPDLRRAIDLNRQEYKGIGMVVFSEIMTAVRDLERRPPSATPPKKPIDVLSESVRKGVLEDLACLEKGALDPDKSRAAEAAEVLGFLQFLVLADSSAAEKSFRQSIELNPKRAVAWEFLANCLMELRKYRELEAICREQLKYKDSARNRLMLAKAYDYLHQLDKAEEVVRAGLQREPDDFMLRLALVDLLLMRGEEVSLYQAGQLIAKLRNEKLSDDGRENRWINYTFAGGIYYGLIGHSEEAREWLKAVKHRQPQYAGIESALKALEE